MSKNSLSNKTSYIILTVIILVSLALSTFFMFTKQGFHEDELLTYNLANSAHQLTTDGGWNTKADFNDYLTVNPNDRFDVNLVIKNQIIDASHPPFYYFLVNTVCSFFPGVFSKWFAYSINAVAMTGILIMLFKIGKLVSKNNFHSLTAVGAYALSIACITTTIYLRMYATLTFFVLSFIYLTIKLYNTVYTKDKPAKPYIDCIMLFIVVLLGVLTQYYFILFAGLTGLVFLIFTLKNKEFSKLVRYIITALLAAAAAFAIYPYIISNVLGGNRGLGSLSFNVDFITIVTYVIYKLGTYVQIVAKELFVNQLWLAVLCTVCALAFAVYMSFFKKKKLSRNAVFIVIPAVIFFTAIALISPFNSDRYVMASLPLIVMIFVFAFIKIIEFVRGFGFAKKNILKFAAPVLVLAVTVCGLITVKPYYTYGKTNLYNPQSENCMFVGTAMLEWNKCIDKMMQYDNTMIVQTDKMSPTLGQKLENFAEKRGVITHGKISEMAKAYMNNGGEKEKTDSMQALKTDKKLNENENITIYVSRLADNDYVLNYIKENTKFKHCKLIQKDYDFDEFYNWYDYFAETESYCNVYLFY